MVVYTLLSYSYTLGMYLVFYKIPDNYGLITYKKKNVLDMPIQIDRSKYSMVADDIVAEHMKVEQE